MPQPKKVFNTHFTIVRVGRAHFTIVRVGRAHDRMTCDILSYINVYFYMFR